VTFVRESSPKWSPYRNLTGAPARLKRRSPMRCSTNRTSQSLLTESKKAATSASKMKFTRLIAEPEGPTFISYKVKQEPMRMLGGDVVLVDDGKCPKGQIRQVSMSGGPTGSTMGKPLLSRRHTHHEEPLRQGRRPGSAPRGRAGPVRRRYWAKAAGQPEAPLPVRRRARPCGLGGWLANLWARLPGRPREAA
jgi:hypothetical protein